jgi:hypothetical protein
MYGEVTLRNKRGDIRFLEPLYPISDQVYEYLKEKTRCGDIEPGQRLRQLEVVESLRASCSRYGTLCPALSRTVLMGDFPGAG